MTDERMLAVGIDPDTKSTGVAVVQAFNGGLQVVHVGLVRAKGRKSADRRFVMAREMMDWFAHADLPYTPTAVTIEWQKLRPKGEKNPNSIVDLCGIAGMAYAAGTLLGADMMFAPIPSEWKGTVPKSVHQKRIVSRLHLTMDLTYIEGYGNGCVPGSEKIPASMKTHVIDALGLACWTLDPHGPIFDARLSQRVAAEKRIKARR